MPYMKDKNRKPRSGEHYESLLKAYEREPSITNYVRLRRAYGAHGIIGKFLDFDPLAIEAELKSFGIDPLLVVRALDEDENERDESIDELAFRMMECLVERNKLEEEGHTHVQSRRIAISDSLVDFLIVAMLETFDGIGDTALSILIRERLCGQNPDYYKDLLVFRQRRKALALAAVRFPAGKISIRKIAKLMNVEPSTVSRWFPAGDFQKQVDEFRKSIDAFRLRGEAAGGLEEG